MSDYVLPQPFDTNPYADGSIATIYAGGLTKRELTCILTRVPATGDAELDAIIRQAQRRDIAAQAMQGLMSDIGKAVDQIYLHADVNRNQARAAAYDAGAKLAVQAADALLVALAEEKSE